MLYFHTIKWSTQQQLDGNNGSQGVWWQRFLGREKNSSIHSPLHSDKQSALLSVFEQLIQGLPGLGPLDTFYVEIH